MQNSRLTKVVLLWDQKFSDKYPHLSTWSGEVRQIFENCGLRNLYDNPTTLPLKETIGSLKSKMKLLQNTEIKTKCCNKPQLKIFVQFSNFDEKPPHLIKPLTFIQRKFLCKLSASCLELRICTGRYTRLPEVDRVCMVTEECKTEKRVESEVHFLFRCSSYNELRQRWFGRATLPDNFDRLADMEKMKVVTNLTNVKSTAQFIVEAFRHRTKVLFVRTNRN